MLPSKTIPTTGHGSGKHLCWLHQQPTVEEIEDNDSPQQLSQTLSSDSSFVLEEIGSSVSGKKNKPKDVWLHPSYILYSMFPEIFTHSQLRRNPIYHFYEMVKLGNNGKVGNPGDRHYKCYHRNRKVLMIMRAMKSNLNGEFKFFRWIMHLSYYLLQGLIGNLKSCLLPMHSFYTLLKERPVDDPITQEEISIASGKTTLNPGATANYIKNLEEKSESIHHAFEKQESQAIVSSCLENCGIFFGWEKQYTGWMGPSKIRRAAAWVDHHLWSAIQRSGETWVQEAYGVYKPPYPTIKITWPKWYQATSSRYGRGWNKWDKNHVCCMPSSIHQSNFL